jgi:hypothetical protein
MGVDPAQQSGSPRAAYVAGITGVLLGLSALALNVVARVRSEPQPPPSMPMPAAAVRDEHPELEARLAAFDRELAQLGAALRKRIDALEKRRVQHPDAPPSASAPPPDLASFYERLSAIETNLEREGTVRIQGQEDLLARVHQLESTRDAGTEARLAAQRAAEERVFNVEQRIHAAETQIVEAEKRLSARIEQLEAR